MSDMQETINWKISVPIFKNSVILKQLGLAIGIPFGIITLIIVFTSGKSIYTIYALGLILSLLILTWLFVMVVYGGKYEAEFLINEKGVLCQTQAKQAKKNKLINALTMLLGLLSAKPAVAGAGMLAQSKQKVFLPWSSITSVKYKPTNHTIVLRGGFAEQIALFCTKENYLTAKMFVTDNTKRVHLK